MFNVVLVLSRALPVLILVSCYWLVTSLAQNEAISNTADEESGSPGTAYDNETRRTSITSVLERLGLSNFSWTVNSPQEALEVLEKFGVFYSLPSAMKIFKTKHCRTNYHVTALLENFHIYCPNITEKMDKPPPEIRAPFIAVECIHKKTRSIVTQKLSQKLKGMMLYNPPNFMHIAGKKFNQSHIMRRSFFTLGNYATGYAARNPMVRLPCITAGYWIDQAVYRVAKTFQSNLPPKDSIIYSWPENLYQPDFHFFVNHKPPYIPETGLETVDMKTLMTEIFRRWRGANLIEINSTIVYLEIVSIMINNINRVLNTTYPRPRPVTALF